MAFISKKIEDLLNFRILEEEKSSRIYLAMSEYLKFHGFEGAAALWKKYSDEEMVHARKVYTYLSDLDLYPVVQTIPEPQRDFKGGLIEICKLSYEHEMDITKQCNELAKVALAEGDHMTTALGQWFVTEQTEEIGKITYWLNRIDILGGEKISPLALYMLDGEMGGKA
jgi:ferritin